jgi:hypothetical protein
MTSPSRERHTRAVSPLARWRRLSAWLNLQKQILLLSCSVGLEHGIVSNHPQGSQSTIRATNLIKLVVFPTYLQNLTLLTYLLMELSPPWGAINWAATHELPSSSWNPNVQYRLHKSPPLVPILSHINPIHTIPPYLSQIHANIVYPPTSRSSQWSLSFWLSHRYPICIPLHPHSCYMPRPSHPPWLQ